MTSSGTLHKTLVLGGFLHSDSFNSKIRYLWSNKSKGVQSVEGQILVQALRIDFYTRGADGRGLRLVRIAYTIGWATNPYTPYDVSRPVWAPIVQCRSMQSCTVRS